MSFDPLGADITQTLDFELHRYNTSWHLCKMLSIWVFFRWFEKTGGSSNLLSLATRSCFTFILCDILFLARFMPHLMWHKNIPATFCLREVLFLQVVIAPSGFDRILRWNWFFFLGENIKIFVLKHYDWKIKIRYICTFFC